MTPASRLAAFCAARRIATDRPTGDLTLGHQYDRKGHPIALTVADIEAVLRENERLTKGAAHQDAQHAIDAQMAQS